MFAVPLSAGRAAAMTLIFAFVLALANTAATSEAAAQSARDRAAIQGVITRQLDAFKLDDKSRAFSFASPTIQRMMGSPERFLALVARSYPQVYRSKSHRFLTLGLNGNRLVQRVLVEGENGSVVTALYEMVRVDGTWRINGCRLIRGDAV
ncbi:MAG: DUF4864 domain-containing protein [Pseudomonadota bacterium]